MFRRQRGFIAAPMLGIGRRSSASDPNFASVVLLALNENGPDAGTTFDDASNSNKALTAVGDAQWDTAQAPTGMTSSGLFDGTGDRITTPDHDDWTFGSGDYTLEAWIRWNSVANATWLAHDNGAPNRAWIWLYETNQFRMWTDGVYRLQEDWTPATATWYHIAICRSGTNLRAFIDGTQLGATATSSENIPNLTSVLQIGGLGWLGGYDFNGWICPARITTAARYTANFTSPTLPLPTS